MPLIIADSEELMKHAAVFLFATLSYAAPVIFTDPVEVTGSGKAFEIYPSDTTPNWFELAFQGSTGGVSVYATIHISGGGVGVLGNGGASMSGFSPAGFASISDGVNTYSSQYFSYWIHTDQVSGPGNLTLFDYDSTVIAQTALSGLFVPVLTGEFISDTMIWRTYDTFVVENPEPGTWAMLAGGILLLGATRLRAFASRRSRACGSTQ